MTPGQPNPAAGIRAAAGTGRVAAGFSAPPRRDPRKFWVDLPRDDEGLALLRQDAEYLLAIADLNDDRSVAENTRTLALAWLEDARREQQKRQSAGYRCDPLATRGGIPRTVIDDLLRQVDLLALCEHYAVRLRCAGPGVYQGLCPFHTEQHPSFYVYADRSHPYFRCWGCGARGDGITLVAFFERIDFLPAVDALAVIAGITPPSEQRLTTRPPRALRSREVPRA